MSNSRLKNGKGMSSEHGNVASRRNYLLKLASQVLTSIDYAEFKDLVEDSIITEYDVLDKKSKKIVTRNF